MMEWIDYKLDAYSMEYTGQAIGDGTYDVTISYLLMLDIRKTHDFINSLICGRCHIQLVIF